jgi:hypothetical protein
MKRRTMPLVSLALCALLSFLPVAGQAQSSRMLGQAELESLLAPIALYPDAVIAEVLAAAAYPERLGALPYEELRERMIESPDWTRDLGMAYAWQQTDLWHAVHSLRMRAGSYGQPTVEVPYVAPHLYYVPYYNPVLVYGPSWRPHRPVYWRPWPPRQVIVVTNSFRHGRSPNGPPSVAVQMQQGNRPSPAVQMQQARPQGQDRHSNRPHRSAP